MLDGSAALTFRIKGGSDLKEYRIDVGLLPAWMWRGRISRIRIEFDAETSIVDISSIEIRTYLSNSETLYIN